MQNNICLLEVNVYCLCKGELRCKFGRCLCHFTYIVVKDQMVQKQASVMSILYIHFETLLQSMDRGQSADWEMMKEKRLDRVNEWTCWWIMVWESSCNNQHYFHIDCNNWVGAGKCTSIAFETISSLPPASFLWTKYQILHSFQELSSLWGGKSIINNHESQKTVYERALVQTTLFWINNSLKAHLKIKSKKVFA